VKIIFTPCFINYTSKQNTTTALNYCKYLHIVQHSTVTFNSCTLAKCLNNIKQEKTLAPNADICDYPFSCRASQAPTVN